jgi:sugar phosphate permease
VTSLGYAALTFALGALAYWSIELLVSNKGLDKETANIKLGIYVTLGGLFGTLIGGWIGDQLLKWFKGGYFLLCAVSSAMAVIPLIITLSSVNPNVYFPTVFLTVFLLFLGNGPINAIIVNVVPSNVRATAVATTILAIHVLGDAISQPLVGILSTKITESGSIPSFIAPITTLLGLSAKQSLSVAMLITPIALLVATFCFILGLIKKPKEQ